MKSINLRNQKLINTLQPLTDYIFDEKNIERLRSIVRPLQCKNIPNVNVTSEDYLRKALSMDRKLFGYPQGAMLIEIKNIQDAEIHKKINDRLFNISTLLGTACNALSAFYPACGNIGWHHNGNAPGYNIIFTYNPTGKGNFYYYDKKSDSIVTMKDKVGWDVKVGYYGNDGSVAPYEENRIFWHAADTENDRLTVAWILNHKPMWLDMIDDIETE